MVKMEINKKLIIGIIVVAAAATTGIISAVIIFQPQPQDNLDSRIRSLMTQAGVPSLSAGIIVNDTLEWSKGYGDQPDGLNTVYMIGSVSKMFTATTIMHLYDNGSLDLDTDINNYLPFSVRNPNFPGTPITIRMLLSHSSSMGHPDMPLWHFDADFINWANTNLGWNLTAWDPRPTLGEFLNGSLNPAGPYYKSNSWRNFLPGSDWQYSNLGMLLLSYIVEEIANQPYIEYLQENVLDPLDMISTGFNYTDYIGRNAIPYEEGDTGLIEGPIYNQYGIGDGGLRSTVPDLANFLIAHMNQGSYNSTQILQPQTVDLMQTTQLSLSGTELGGFFYIGWGLGWPLYTQQIIGHGGAIPGYLTQISFKTVSNGKYGIVFMLNKGSSLTVDTYLIDTFFPSIINLLFDEAARLFALN
jgi:CubicO group peptidase (beta-lactamase class C family)